MTEEEKSAIVAEVMAQIKIHSQSVNALHEVSTLDGVVSLPAIKGSVVVSVPISLLGKAVTIDSVLDLTSENAVMNKVIAAKLKTLETSMDKNIGGTVLVDRFGTDDFETSFRAAIAYAKANGFSVVDASWFSGEWACASRFRIDFPVTIRLGNVTLRMVDTNFFEISSNNVRIEGVNRQTDRTATDLNATTLILGGVSNSSSEGYHIYSRGAKNCQYRNMVLVGRQTSIGRQCESVSYPIDGTGGIYIEKANPGTTSSGNTCNATVIENLLIDGTKAHGIYIDTPILSMIRNVRISYAGGHGVFITGGTTTTMESVYVASARYAGFCLQGVTYCTVLNSVAENCGCGWWLRSVFNTSLFSPGVESTFNYGQNPWAGAYRESARYGLAVNSTGADGTVVKISDVPDDAWPVGSTNYRARSLFCGYAFVITGGRNVDIYSAYATSIANELSPSSPLLSTVQEKLCYMLIAGNSRAVKISNAGFSERTGSPIPTVIRHEVVIGDGAVGLDLSYNPDNAVMPTWTSMSAVTDDDTLTAPVLCLSSTSIVHCGNRYYTNVDLRADAGVQGSVNVSGQLIATTGIVSKGPVVEYDTAQINLTYTISPDVASVDYTYDGTVFSVVPKATLVLDDITNDSSYILTVDGTVMATQTGVGPMTFKLSTPGDHIMLITATYGDKTASTDARTITVSEPTNLAIKFINMTIKQATDTSVLLEVTYQGTYIVTEAGIAYSSSNQSPTTSQNSMKLTSLDSIVNDADGLAHTYLISLPRTSSSTTRYVRGYINAKENADSSATTYYGTTVYMVSGSDISII